MNTPAAGRRARRLCFAVLIALPAGPARAEPAVRILDLPFKVREMRGPRSEVAVAVATSGLLPIARAKPIDADAAREPGDEESAPIAVVWGEDGGAVLGLEGGTVSVRPIGREAVEGLTAAETPRGALPGSRRALSGPVSAWLTGPARGSDGGPAARALTVRERQAVAVSTDPKPVPVETVAVPAGADAVFAPDRPRALRLSGRPAFLVTTLAATPGDAGGLALIARPGDDPAGWTVAARTPPGEPAPRLAAIADFAGAGAPQAATVDAAGLLRLWTLKPGAIEPAGQRPGYAAIPGHDFADIVTGGPAPDLAVPVRGEPALAILTARGPLNERLRVALPAPAATGVAVLGAGAGARVLVGLADGRVAAIAPDGGKP